MLGACHFLHAQKSETDRQVIIEQRLEIISNTLEEGQELDYTNLLEDLIYYFEHPLDLNSADIESLRDLYLLSDIQIASLFAHIERYGVLRSIYELQAVQGFDIATIRAIEPFVRVGEQSTFSQLSMNNLRKDGNHDLFIRYRRTLQKQAGFIPDPDNNNLPDFAGSPDYIYMRYRFQFKKNVTAGFTVEKDAGESLKKGPDFYSGHVFIRNKGLLKTIAIGDYQAQFGQGLTFWNGLGFGKSVFILNVKKSAQGLRPYTSVNEALFMRGAAATLGYKRWDLSLFASSKKLSGNVELNTDSLATDDGLIVTSLLIGGLHRTETEIENKGTLNERIVGSNLKYSRGTFSAGVTATYLNYSDALQRDAQLYQAYRFSGSENMTVGADYQGVYRNVNYFGEIARSQNGGMGAINGIVASLHSRLTMSLVHRYFDRSFQSIYSNVFAEGNNLSPSNENGIFIGAQASFSKGWSLTVYSDQVKFPWLRFQVDRPGSMSDHLAQLNWKPDRKHDFYFRYRVRNSEENGSPEEARIDYPVERRQQNIRLNGAYQAHENVRMQTRLEWNLFEKTGEASSSGFMLFQDITFKKLGLPFSITARYAIFNTDSWDSRIYAYENDVLYSFSIPAYSGRGSRAYLMLKYDLARGLDIWVRAATWLYTDRTVISSGTSEIEGNQRTDITVQMRYQF